jgi:hypothetical protein
MEARRRVRAAPVACRGTRRVDGLKVLLIDVDCAVLVAHLRGASTTRFR